MNNSDTEALRDMQSMTFTLAEKDQDGFWKILGEGIPADAKISWETEEPIQETDPVEELIEALHRFADYLEEKGIRETDELEIPEFMRREK